MLKVIKDIYIIASQKNLKNIIFMRDGRNATHGRKYYRTPGFMKLIQTSDASSTKKIMENARAYKTL